MIYEIKLKQYKGLTLPNISNFILNKRSSCVCQKHNAPYCAALNIYIYIYIIIYYYFLTFDLERWLWPFTTQNVQLHEIHMHAKYQVAIINIAKVMTIFRNLKAKYDGISEGQTDGQTDGQCYHYMPTFGGIKNCLQIYARSSCDITFLNCNIYVS